MLAYSSLSISFSIVTFLSLLLVDNLGFLVSNAFHMNSPSFLELIYPSFAAPIINCFINYQFILRIHAHPSTALTNFISQHKSVLLHAVTFE